MRSEEEIRAMFDNLGEHEPDGTKALDWKGNNFKYGYLCGKAEALAWVLGDKNAGAMNSNFDFEDFKLEQASHRGTIPPLEGGNP